MKKGFTLIELLAVIVILAIILVIAIPAVSGIIDNAKRSAFEDNTKMVLKAINYKLAQDSSYDVTRVVKGSGTDTIASELGLDSSNYSTVAVSLQSGKPYVQITGTGKWDGLIAIGDSSSITVSNATVVQAPNTPVLATGMTPIKWNGSAWIDTTSTDTSWYDYTNQQWANARTADGSMWVWIPRYVYKISSGWHSSTTGTIEVKFSAGTDDTLGGTVSLANTGTANDSNNTWTSEPAFTFGSTQLAGFWAAKFEATATQGIASSTTVCNAADDVTTKTIKIIPNVTSWRCIKVGNAFTVIRNMETSNTYGWGTTGNGIDTHLMKNVEWGAVAYLSKSSYGKNTDEVWINPSDTLTTGCAGDSVSSASTTGCLRTYDTTNGQKASTTGNTYGVYDMSGGTDEFVASYFDWGSSYLNTNGSQIVSAASQYKETWPGHDESQMLNYNETVNKKGDAWYEVSNSFANSDWFSDQLLAPNTAPWLARGWNYSWGSSAGIFGLASSHGDASITSFRPVLSVAAGL